MGVLDPGDGHPGRDRQGQVEQHDGYEGASADERETEADAAREKGAGQEGDEERARREQRLQRCGSRGKGCACAV